MTRAVTVNTIKKGKQSSTIASDGKPKLGSKIRVIYDRLRLGEHISKEEIISYVGVSVMYVRLKNDYGMDVAMKNSKYYLLGEYYGPYYVPINKIIAEENNDLTM